MPVKPSGVETNLAGLVLRHGENTPEYPALIVPTRWNDDEVLDEVCLSYGELAERISRVRGGLARAGIGEGDRVVVMFGVRADHNILVLALLAAGVAVVLIDTGMGKERVLQAMKLARPKAIMSIDALLKHRLWLPALWGMRRYSIDRPRLGVRSFSELLQSEPLSGPALERAPGAPGLITFTSGTTGRPKGANRTHDLLIAQHEALKEHFPATADEIDMPCFPVVPLHNLCSGITTVMPAVDFRQPASVEPGVVVSQIRAHGVTRFAGAPAYMTRIANH
ncbi:MAG: AMP-binding protein, partial [Bradymonadaceae bacterium]